MAGEESGLAKLGQSLSRGEQAGHSVLGCI